MINTNFIKNGSTLAVKFIMISGSREIKELILSSSFLNDKIKKIVRINIFSEDSNIDRLISENKSILEKIDQKEDQKKIQKFSDLLASDPSKVVYGKMIKNYIREGLVKELFISMSEDESQSVLESYGLCVSADETEGKGFAKEEKNLIKIGKIETNYSCNIDGYGEMVGILWYSLSDSVREEVEGEEKTDNIGKTEEFI